jgi:hypothetical protein
VTNTAWNAKDTTTITVYGGTDYALVNGKAITLNYFSRTKAPQGFPMNPDKWSVYMGLTQQQTVATPTSNTWYWIKSTDVLNLPIGSWIVTMQSTPMATCSSQWATLGVGFTKLTPTGSNPGTVAMKDLTADTPNWITIANGASFTAFAISMVISEAVSVTAKTPIYPVQLWGGSAAGTTLYNDVSGRSHSIRALCAYL